MKTGIAIYLGLDNTFEENIQLIETAAKYGVQRIFTSLHIPETDKSSLKKQISEVLNIAKKNNMEVISDISPATLEILGIEKFNLSAFQFLGIQTLRLDYGYDAEQITKFSHNTKKIRIQLNASTITARLLMELMKLGANFANIDALHNFYPREGTGISEETLVRKNSLLHKAGIRVGAFIPSQHRRRSPLKAGLPTLEMHRHNDVSLAARHLAAIGIDSIFIGDSLPSIEELETLSQIKENEIEVKAQLLSSDEFTRNLLSHTFTARVDEARDAVRAQESRSLLNGTCIKSANTKVRSYGSITLDNEDYLRYMGELQIIKMPQPADKRVNVVGKVLNNEEFLLNYIIPGKKFSFIFE
ncbi:DUF871 domain-containing protein [Propionispira raffinosivorans]|uniref:DUF871 domain-containing protein n=1 Tax=Propionispira raffinosivorans TaxID=86959 RepID=UPI00036324F5|nr:MupG family TIM beta-alpha barrel fold protein [Propionispira raffinosivorans]